MKQLIFIMIVLSNILSCDGQQKKTVANNKNTTDKMRTFDIKQFEDNKGKQGFVNEYHYILNDSSDIREFSSKAASDNFELRYQREITKKFSPLKSVYTYYETGTICTSASFFNNSHIGLYKKVDENGKLIKEINDDKNFKHTFEQIHDIVLKEKKVDIYDTRQAVALRHDSQFGKTGIKKYYQIHVLKSKFVDGEWYSQPDYSFIIDDETGKIVTQEEINKIQNR